MTSDSNVGNYMTLLFRIICNLEQHFFFITVDSKQLEQKDFKTAGLYFFKIQFRTKSSTTHSHMSQAFFVCEQRINNREPSAHGK